MRIFFILNNPVGDQEAIPAFAEIAALQRRGHAVLVCSLTSGPEILPFDFPLAADSIVTIHASLTISLASLARAPIRMMTAYSTVMRACAGGCRTYNRQAFWQGVAAVNLAQHWQADVIHAEGFGAPATAAFACHTLSRVPWSITMMTTAIDRHECIYPLLKSAKYIRFLSIHDEMAFNNWEMHYAIDHGLPYDDELIPCLSENCPERAYWMIPRRVAGIIQSSADGQAAECATVDDIAERLEVFFNSKLGVPNGNVTPDAQAYQ